MEVLSISEFHKVTNLWLAEAGEFAVQGEITQLRLSRNGGVFIDMKDPQGNGVLKVSNFSRNMEGHLSVTEGMQVVVQGYSEVYAPYGSISFKARKISPVGEGSLKAAFEKLRLELEREGLFAQERKRPLPQFITKIALISGKDSAAYADFTKILAESGSSIEVDFYPVLVQGESSEREVVAAMRAAQQSQAELIVLARGGGSLEDLRSFNSEGVARAVYASSLPVIVGVGHEVDTTIADLVADVRASTPSQAAYYIASHNSRLISDTALKTNQFLNDIALLLPDYGRLKQSTTRMREKLLASMIGRRELELQTRLLSQAAAKYLQKTADMRSRLGAINMAGDRMRRQLRDYSSSLDLRTRLISSYNPESVLGRGYSLVQVGGKFISSPDALLPGMKIKIKFKTERSLEAEVLAVN